MFLNLVCKHFTENVHVYQGECSIISFFVIFVCSSVLVVKQYMKVK